MGTGLFGFVPSMYVGISTRAAAFDAIQEGSKYLPGSTPSHGYDSYYRKRDTLPEGPTRVPVWNQGS